MLHSHTTSTPPALSGNRPRYLLLAILALGVLLRFFAIDAKTVWLDEAFSIWIAHHSLWELWGWLVRIDHHPPLYYTLLHLWQSLLGDTQGIVRSLSALCSALAIPLVYATARRLFDQSVGLTAALILAVMPFHVRFAQEARMYALLTLGAALALYFATRLLMDNGPHQSSGKPCADAGSIQASRKVSVSSGLAIGLGAAQAAVMLSHNTATIFFPLALNLPVLGALFISRHTGKPSSWPALKTPGFLRRWLLGQAVAILLWLPWAVPFVIQAKVVDNEFWLWPPTARMIWDTFHNFNVAFIPGWFPGLVLWDLIYWLLAASALFALRKQPARAFFLLSLFLTPVIGELLASLRRPIFYDRTLIWTTLAYYILLAAGIAYLGRLLQRKSLPESPTPAQAAATPATRSLSARHRRSTFAFSTQLAAVALILFLSGVSLWAYYVHFEKEEWDKAAAYVATRVEPGQLVLFNASWVQIPFEYYFRHYETGAELRGLPNDLFDSGALEPKMTTTDLSYLDDLLANRNHVWLVYSHDWYSDPDQLIPKQLSKNMQETDRQQFVGLQVIQYKTEGE